MWNTIMHIHIEQSMICRKHIILCTLVKVWISTSLFILLVFKETTEKVNKKTYSDSAAVPNNNFLKCSYSFRTRCRETFIECRFLSMNFYCPRIFMYFCQTLNRSILITVERIFIKKRKRRKNNKKNKL